MFPHVGLMRSCSKLIYSQSNPFTRLSEIVSTLTTIGHLDVYSLSKESIQRMLPTDKSNGTTLTTSPVPPRDTRAFQYRFSMAYVRALPEAQRPVEREVFGKSMSGIGEKGSRANG